MISTTTIQHLWRNHPNLKPLSSCLNLFSDKNSWIIPFVRIIILDTFPPICCLIMSSDALQDLSMKWVTGWQVLSARSLMSVSAKDRQSFRAQLGKPLANPSERCELSEYSNLDTDAWSLHCCVLKTFHQDASWHILI